jgi:hypothetical protein
MGGNVPAPVTDRRISDARIPVQGAYTGRSNSDWTALLEAVLDSQGVDPDAEALIARFTTRPNLRARILIRTAISGLKAAGIWAKLDCLWLLGTDSIDAAMNWVSPNYTLTTFGGEVYVPGQGYDGDGSTAHLNTGFNPTTAGGKYAQDSASIGIWVLEDQYENKDDMGNTNALIRTFIDTSALSAGFRLNSSATSTVSGTSTATQSYGFRGSFGLTWATRLSSAGFNYGRNAQPLGTVTAASVAPSNDTFFLGGGRVADYSRERVAAAFIGGGLTNAEIATLYTVLSPLVNGLRGPDLYTLDLTSTAQTIEGIGFELQCDSIQSDSGGIQESNITSILLDLTPAERKRLAQTIASVPGGSAFQSFRLALGLFHRGITADGKNFVERLPGNNVAIGQFITDAGIKGITPCYWSPAPYWKRVVIGGTTYNGSTTPVPDKVADPTGYNTYLRNMLQGGTLDAPDKASQPAAYAAWMSDFTNHVVQDVEYVHQNIGRVTKFCPQNEPGTTGSTAPGTYPYCNWTGQLFYDFVAALVPKLRASSTLSTYNGSPNRIDIYIGSKDGLALAPGADLIAADSALMAEIYGWAIHPIDTTAKDAAYVRSFSQFILALGRAGKPIFSDENEYFDPTVTAGSATYLTPQFRFANTAMMPLLWFTEIGSPIWWWIHLGKPTTGTAGETTGRALTVWKPPGSAASTAYPSLTDGTFTTNNVNWNAVKPWLRFLPPGSVRLNMPAAVLRNDVAAMAWRKPNGKIVIAIVNRTEFDQRQRITIPGFAGSLSRYRYDVNVVDQVVETLAVSGGLDLTIPPWSAEFLEQN